MKITKVSVTSFKYFDLVKLYTDLPIPDDSRRFDGENLAIAFDCPRGTGVEYARKNFGMEPEIANG